MSDKGQGIKGEMYVTAATSVANVATKLNKLIQVQQQITQMDQFTGEVKANVSNISTLRDYWNQITQKVQDMCPRIKAIIQKDGDLCQTDFDAVMKEVQYAKIKMANEVVYRGAIASAAIFMVQFWKLKEVWNELKDADNVVEESRSSIETIRENIKKLIASANELNEQMNRCEEDKVTRDEKNQIMKRIGIRVSRLSANCIDTRCMISELKVKMDGKIEVLHVYLKEQFSNAIQNGVHFGSNLIECVQYWDLMGTGTKVMQAGITGTFLALTAANVTMYTLTNVRLEKIREVLDEIKQMEDQLRSVIGAINIAEDFLSQHEKD